ncbi:MAG TPA: hypothetical protein VIY51_03355 [Xanthobacteraceae bacterium]
MSRGLKSILVSTSGAFAVAAVALSLTFGGTSAVRADDRQIVFVEGQEMALVPLKSIEALEQRVVYLEETVTSLTQAWQHIDTHHICVSDYKGETETCLTKHQLDDLLAMRTPVAGEQAAIAAPPPAAEPVETVATVEEAQPPAAIIASEARQDEPEQTGSIGAVAPPAPAEAPGEATALPQSEAPAPND